jgi:hypothetical protein
MLSRLRHAVGIAAGQMVDLASIRMFSPQFPGALAMIPVQII